MTLTARQRESLQDRLREVYSSADIVFAKQGLIAEIVGSELPIVAVTTLTADLGRVGNGLVLWKKQASGRDLAQHFVQFCRSKRLNNPPLNADMKVIAKANTLLVSNGNIVLFGFYTGGNFDRPETENFLRRLKRSGTWNLMTDATEQISFCEALFRDAKFLVEKHAAERPPAMVDKAARAIAFAVEECIAGRSEALDHILKIAAGQLTASGRKKKKAQELPTLPEGFAWPTERFCTSPEVGKWGGQLAYLERVWQPLIKARLVDRPLLKLADPELANALAGYLHNRGKSRRTLPSHLDIPLRRAPSRRRKTPKAAPPSQTL